MRTKYKGQKGLSFILLVSVMLGMLGAIPAQALSGAEAQSGQFTYTVEGESCTITGYNGEAVDLVIPSEIDGYSVTTMGDSVFKGCTSLTSVTIPESVTEIGGHAFLGCTGLTSITIPDGVTTIGECAFLGCTGLTSVTISASVIGILEYAFNECTGLTAFAVSEDNPAYASEDGILF